MSNSAEDVMNRRHFLLRAAGAATGVVIGIDVRAAETTPAPIAKVVKTDAEWRKVLTPQQYNVLREEGTERPFSSPLNNEKRKGIFVCAGCDLPLFDSRTKYDSGTGWPSFWDVIKGAVETKGEAKAAFMWDEYHCARCGGHHGHVFNDGPKPTGLRYCENGVAVKFIPA
jgi:peptide-methionine (R)-S-oxide reductase